ncbi:MAG: hypothetical protein LBT89_07920 [Planctomycetaceae bacterium]|jgi:hypothetical protein|nr:hypothetical protein [Planctomycetaceae bacterium]
MLRFSVFVLILLSAGCICDRERFGLPDLLHPGHISEQQERMERFDPFTRSDIGPKIQGDRPNGALDQKPTEQRFIKK